MWVLQIISYLQGVERIKKQYKGIIISINFIENSDNDHIPLKNIANHSKNIADLWYNL